MCQMGVGRAVELLLRAGADPNLKTAAKDTCLHISCCYGTGKAVKGKGAVTRMLLDFGADVDIPDSDGNTPLHFAAYHHRDGILELLLELMMKEHKERGAPLHVNVKNKKGDTPLHKAAWNGKETALQQLLDHGGDMNIRNGRGRTTYAMAKLNRNEVCMEMLEDETNDCWAIMNDPNSLCVGNHIVHHGDMTKLLNKLSIHRPVQLASLRRENIIEIQKLMKPIAKRQWTRLLHTEVEKRAPTRNASLVAGHPPLPPAKPLTAHDWDQLLRLSNDRCQDCGDLLLPVKVKKHHVFVHDILKVADSIDEIKKDRLKKYTSTYCGEYIRSLNEAWFLLHNKHSILDDKNDDNTYVYTVDSMVDLLDEMRIECGEDLGKQPAAVLCCAVLLVDNISLLVSLITPLHLFSYTLSITVVTLTDDDSMKLKSIMRVQAKKEFGRLIRRFKCHSSYIAVNGVFTAARNAYILKQSRNDIVEEDEDEDSVLEPTMTMAALDAVQASANA